MMNYLARESLFRANRLFGLQLRLINVIPLELDGDKAAMITGMKESIRRLKSGEMLLVFPEGTRSQDGEVHAFKPGFVILATRSKSPILPVAIVGAFELLPRGSKKIHPGVVDVRFGEPIPVEMYERMSREEIAEEVRKRVLAVQKELRDERAANEINHGNADASSR